MPLPLVCRYAAVVTPAIGSARRFQVGWPYMMKIDNLDDDAALEVAFVGHDQVQVVDGSNDSLAVDDIGPYDRLSFQDVDRILGNEIVATSRRDSTVIVHRTGQITKT